MITGSAGGQMKPIGSPGGSWSHKALQVGASKEFRSSVRAVCVLNLRAISLSLEKKKKKHSVLVPIIQDAAAHIRGECPTLNLAGNSLQEVCLLAILKPVRLTMEIYYSAC